jgi:hypothetical protein
MIKSYYKQQITQCHFMKAWVLSELAQLVKTTSSTKNNVITVTIDVKTYSTNILEKQFQATIPALMSIYRKEYVIN